MSITLMTRSMGAAAAVAALALGAAGCGGGSGSSAPSASDTGSDASSVPASDSSGSDTSSSDASTTTSPSPSAGGTTSGDSNGSGQDGGGDGDQQEQLCTPDNLDITVEQGDSSSGHVNYQIEFRNTSDDPCRISGHPGVQVVGDGNGTQIGKDAAKGEDGESTVLIPNGSAVATLEAVNIGDSGGPLGGDCKVTDADGWRIYPPDSKTAAYVKQDGLKACAGDVDWLTVSGTHPVS